MAREEFVPYSGDPVTLENVGIIYKNFMGQKGQYNEEGELSFNVIIEDADVADAMLRDGFNIKPFVDEDERITAYHFHVKVNYGGRRPPRIYRVTQDGRRQQLLSQQTVGMLDSVTITKADITIGTWYWRESPLPNISAYCNVLYAHVHEDPLDLKYSHLAEGSYYEE